MQNNHNVQQKFFFHQNRITKKNTAHDAIMFTVYIYKAQFWGCKILRKFLSGYISSSTRKDLRYYKLCINDIWTV